MPICINQVDEEEKSWQVSLMRDIYKGAAVVMVWLGPSADDSDLAMDTINAIGSRALNWRVQDRYVVGNWMMDDFAQRYTSNSSLKDEDDTIEDSFLEFSFRHGYDDKLPTLAIQALLDRSWWRRIWVLQEFAVARKAIFACGSKRVYSDCFDSALIFFATRFLATVKSNMRLPDTKQDPANRTKDVDFTSKLGTFEDFAALSTNNGAVVMFNNRRDFQNSHQYTLWALLRKGPFKLGVKSGLQASDPRDIIFALLGLSKDAEMFSMFPDYSKSCAYVYTKVSKILLSQGRLDLLNFCNTHDWSDMPSWVPNWSSRFDHGLFKQLGLGLKPAFSACQSRQSSVTSQDDSRLEILEVSGFVYDQIQSVLVKSTDKNLNDLKSLQGEDMPGIVREWFSAAAKMLFNEERGEFSSGESEYEEGNDREWEGIQDEDQTLAEVPERHLMFKPLLRTLAAGQIMSFDNMDFQRIGEELESLQTIVLGILNSNSLGLATYQLGEAVINEYRKPFEERDPNTFSDLQLYLMMAPSAKLHDGIFMDRAGGLLLGAYISALGRLTVGRHVFKTLHGHIGLGPDDLLPGDVVAVLFGADTPFILRPREQGGYQLIGEAYVDGIMDGELMAAQLAEEVFELY